MHRIHYLLINLTMKKILPISLLINAFLFLPIHAQYGPAGVGGEEENELGKPVNSLWLRAHDLLEDFNDGEEVDEWADFSDFGNDAVFPAGRTDLALPTLQADTMNGHAWLNFNGNTFLEVPDDPSLDGGAGLAIFIVVNRNAYGDYPDTEFGEQSLVTKRKHWNSTFKISSPTTAARCSPKRPRSASFERAEIMASTPYCAASSTISSTSC